MNEEAEYFAFAFEPLRAYFSHQCDVQKLDGDLPLESPVNSLCKPDAAHASLTDLRDQLVDTNSLIAQARYAWQCWAFFQEAFFGERTLLVEERLESPRYAGAVGAQRGQPDETFIVGHPQRFIEVRTQDLPFIQSQRTHWLTSVREIHAY